MVCKVCGGNNYSIEEDEVMGVESVFYFVLCHECNWSTESFPSDSKAEDYWMSIKEKMYKIDEDYKHGYDEIPLKGEYGLKVIDNTLVICKRGEKVSLDSCVLSEEGLSRDGYKLLALPSNVNRVFAEEAGLKLDPGEGNVIVGRENDELDDEDCDNESQKFVWNGIWVYVDDDGDLTLKDKEGSKIWILKNMYIDCDYMKLKLKGDNENE